MSVKNAIRDIIVWRGLNFLSVFILNVLVARTFEASRAGTLFFFVNNLALVILVVSFSLESGLGYYAASQKIGKRQLGMLALLWSGGAALLSFFLIAGIIDYTGRLEGIHSTLAATIFITGSLLTSFFSSLYFARSNFFTPNLILVVVNLLLIGVFIAGMQGQFVHQWLLYAYFVSFLIQGLLISGFYFFSTGESSGSEQPKVNLRKIISYSASVFLGNLIFFFVYRIDYWFVETWCSSAELGNYIQVSKIVQWLLLVPMMIGTAVFPLTAKGDDNEITGKIVRVARMLLWIYLLGCLLVALTGHWLFVWIFGDSFTEMYPVFLLHIPGILALASLYPVSSYHAGIRRVDINVKGSLFALAAIIVLNVAFTPTYGIYAASVASSAGYIVYFLFSFYQFSRQHKFTLSEIFKPAASDYRLLKSMLYRRR